MSGTPVMEASAGKALLVFDGRVLEVFNDSTGGPTRYHVARMRLDWDIKLGRLFVRIRPRDRKGEVVLMVKGEELPALQELLTAVEAAMPEPS